MNSEFSLEDSEEGTESLPSFALYCACIRSFGVCLGRYSFLRMMAIRTRVWWPILLGDDFDFAILSCCLGFGLAFGSVRALG